MIPFSLPRETPRMVAPPWMSDEAPSRTLAQLREGESATLSGLELPATVAIRLMEMGFLPGSRVTAQRSAPGGDPRVFEVDGGEVALRRETSERITVEVGEGR